MSGASSKQKNIHSFAESVKNQLIVRGGKVMVQENQSFMTNSPRKLNKIVIITCGKSKSLDSKCSAKNAYNGRSFQLKKKYAELSNNPWFILSAKYGFIQPDDIIEPNYDKTIKTKKEIRTLANLIASQIPNYLEFAIADEIIFLGPESYEESIKKAFSNIRLLNIIHPTHGLKQGESQRAIKMFINDLSSMQNCEISQSD
jgi:cytoplasmic iron level regulating protein YaaA (DUF328/UPF0246 family)